MKPVLLALVALYCCVTEARQVLSGERGCYQVSSKSKCCEAIDGRFNSDGNLFGGEFTLSPSVERPTG